MKHIVDLKNYQNDGDLENHVNRSERSEFENGVSDFAQPAPEC